MNYPMDLSRSHAPSVVISNLAPSIEGGRYAAKRISGDPLDVSADVFRDGHGILAATLLVRPKGEAAWEEQAFSPGENDRWHGRLSLFELGEWEYTIEAWEDPFLTWFHEFEKKLASLQSGESLSTEIQEVILLLQAAADRAANAGQTNEGQQLHDLAGSLTGQTEVQVLRLVRGVEHQDLLKRWTDRSIATQAPIHRVVIERERARFSAWYEFFPRSSSGSGIAHETFRDALPRIEYAKDLGFDVIYFPPIHPIGRSFRKGKDNSLQCEPEEPGSPWAIGAAEGGHYDVHPELGTLEDFRWLVDESRKLGMEIALDFAINCSPDHPYVSSHPDWFFQRPDGTIKYAENPPKKYQDIYPLNFHCEDWRNLWQEMVNIVLFWVDQGVHAFRVDNPHTKPVAFWEYLIGEVREKHPEVVFLAEAFTRPRMMEMLGKIGFSQSYTYFTWRTGSTELRDYVEELTQTEVHDYFRGNFWPNTPDILVPPLVDGNRAAFQVRAVLAATLLPSWGIYGGFELCENQKRP
ncbi:MAG: alpha-1,4-glucan--maltose-1-phosphate maltosyltransferase, partial [Verrucomicrobiota bacterium]